MKELWKPVSGYEGCYEVSSLGRVRSLTRHVNHVNGTCPKYGKILSQSPNTKGYLLVGLCVEGEQKTKTVHKLVALAFLVNPDDLPEVNHKDGNKSNNSDSNLEWSSGEDNIKHATRNGLRAKGKSLPSTKLSESDIPIIRLRIANGESFSKIGKSYGINHKAIIAIHTGRSWSYVP